MQGRRSALKLLSALGSAAIGLAVAVPGVGYVLSPVLGKKRQGGRWFSVGRLESLQEDKPTAVPIIGERRDAWTKYPEERLGTVWLRRRGDQVQALSAECPHLGCSVKFDESKSGFACPCHESAFGIDGERKGGPAPRGLDSLEARVEPNGLVQVRFARYKIQSKEKIERG